MKKSVKLFVCGDVMTGRGIDQILQFPSEATIHEPYVKDAREYVQLAEAVNGKIPKPVNFSHIWGNVLSDLDKNSPDARIINLETSVTSSDNYWTPKGINYRMSPKNTPCLTAASIDCCALANNHILDWGYNGLNETIQTLRKAGIKTCGAGRNLTEAQEPAIIDITRRSRVLVFSYGSLDSGVPPAWAASENRAGVNLLKNFSSETVQLIAKNVETYQKSGDIVVFSVHWGDNWGYHIPPEHRTFAHQLIDEAGVDLVHGHSSHHAKGIEVYKMRLILYGCGDLLNDYEGIEVYEEFRGDLGLLYFPVVSAGNGRLEFIKMVPTKIRRLQVTRTSSADIAWLKNMLSREGRRLGTDVKLDSEGALSLSWQ